MIATDQVKAPSQLPRRTPPEGMQIGHQFVPGDIIVDIHQLATYMSPRHFKNPRKFRPERWLGDSEYKNDHLDAVEPFSYGPQNCLGKVNLAQSRGLKFV